MPNCLIHTFGFHDVCKGVHLNFDVNTNEEASSAVDLPPLNSYISASTITVSMCQIIGAILLSNNAQNLNIN